ncbi:hypothetical protein [Paraburkholderia sp. MM5477-R1]|uniref:hypothetical protein n=1 Tax=Paraburkholderia sp. MM5477-R1 TaxID=2991062 RepID=UPI003D2264D6
MRRDYFSVCLATVTMTYLLSACAASPPGIPSPVVGADRDAHGCIGSAGYSWCESTHQCERPWELARQKGFALSAEQFAHYCTVGSAD